MISIFPLWTFNLYVAPFQQHLYMEYISLRWYDIPELVAPIRISLIEVDANTEATEARFYLVKVNSSLPECHHNIAEVMEYLSELPPISSTYWKHLSGLSSLTTYFRVCNYINTTGATSGSGSTDPSGAPEFTQLFIETRATRPLALYIFFILPCL